MTNQLSHANLFPDLSKVTLRRVFKTDQGWIMEAHGQNSAVCPGCQCISRYTPGCTWVAGVAATLVASGESSPNVSPRFAPHTHNRPSDPARSSPRWGVPS